MAFSPFFFQANSTSAPFTPSSIPGLIQWYDASVGSSITASAGAVSKWADQSGQGNDITATGTAQPTYSAAGNGSVSFNGTANTLGLTGGTAAANLSGGCSMVIVWNNTSNSGGRIYSYAILGGGDDYSDPGSFSLRDNFGGRLEIGHNNTFNDVNISGAAPTLYIVTFDNTNQNQYINGSLAGTFSDTGVFPTNSQANLHIAADNSGSENGDIIVYECLLYKAVLTSGQISSFHSYSQSKWGSP